MSECTKEPLTGSHSLPVGCREAGRASMRSRKPGTQEVSLSSECWGAALTLIDQGREARLMLVEEYHTKWPRAGRCGDLQVKASPCLLQSARSLLHRHPPAVQLQHVPLCGPQAVTLQGQKRLKAQPPGQVQRWPAAPLKVTRQLLTTDLPLHLHSTSFQTPGCFLSA